MKLKALQKKWYRKLKDSGFSDIENTNSPKEHLNTWESTHFHKIYQLRGHEQFYGRAHYYERAGKFLHEYRFKTRTEKQIWEMHSDGRGMREIAKELKLLLSGGGTKNSVHSIIKNLQSVMKTWEFESE